MRKIILYIASSLDGFIAGKDDDLSWLFTNEGYGFDEFFKGIDTILTGRKTYEISLKLEPSFFIDKEVIVFSHSMNIQINNIKTISNNIPEYVKNLKMQDGKDIWLLGGGEITTLLVENNLVDEMLIFIHPILVGEGSPLFKNISEYKKLNFVNSTSYKNGLLEVRYKF